MKLTPIPRRRALASIAAAVGAGVAAVTHGPWNASRAEAAQAPPAPAAPSRPRPQETQALSAAAGPSFELVLDSPVSGVSGGFFTECSGLGSEHEVVEQRVGDDPRVVRKIPGRLKWSDVTLKRGIMSNLDIWTWRKEIEDGRVDTARRSASIIMLDQANKPVAKWHFTNAWPSKVSGPSLKSDDNAVAIEELTLVHEGLVREGLVRER